MRRLCPAAFQFSADGHTDRRCLSRDLMNPVDYISRGKTSIGRPETIGVLIPTYKRPADLMRCLAALQRQELPPSDVMLIVRREDEATQAALAVYREGTLPLRIILVDK